MKGISMNTLIRLKKTTPLVFISLALINFGLLTPVKAVDPTDIFYGTGAGNNTTTANHLTAFGFEALSMVTSGFDNTADGYAALAHNDTGFANTAIGNAALANNTSGNHNSAIGAYAMLDND